MKGSSVEWLTNCFNLLNYSTDCYAGSNDSTSFAGCEHPYACYNLRIKIIIICYQQSVRDII